MVPIAGLSGARVLIFAAARTRDGGGVVIARSMSHAAATGGTVQAARLNADGSLDLAYGAEGLAELHAGAHFIPAALAINPGTGAAWIAGSVGLGQEVVALTPNGERASGFGHHGVLRLAAADGPAVLSLAWNHGRLLLDAGAKPCIGCVVSVLAAASGRRLHMRASLPTTRHGCHTSHETGAQWLPGMEVAVGTAAAGSGCSGAILTLNSSLEVSRRLTSPVPVPVSAVRLWEGAPGTGICVSGLGSHRLELWGDGQKHASNLSRASGARIDAVVSLGQGACAALLHPRRGQEVVAQVRAGGAPIARTALPEGFHAATMFRCNAHLLVLGTVGRSGRQSAQIVPVPVSRGPYVPLVGHRPERESTSTGCQ
jgi:hypothetical protein